MDEIKCPVCGEVCDTIYRDKWLDAIGCENCVTWMDAWDWAETNGTNYDDDRQYEEGCGK